MRANVCAEENEQGDEGVRELLIPMAVWERPIDRSNGRTAHDVLLANKHRMASLVFLRSTHVRFRQRELTARRCYRV